MPKRCTLDINHTWWSSNAYVLILNKLNLFLQYLPLPLTSFLVHVDQLCSHHELPLTPIYLRRQLRRFWEKNEKVLGGKIRLNLNSSLSLVVEVSFGGAFLRFQKELGNSATGRAAKARLPVLLLLPSR